VYRASPELLINLQPRILLAMLFGLQDARASDVLGRLVQLQSPDSAEQGQPDKSQITQIQRAD
jgi:hypothetical protein